MSTRANLMTGIAIGGGLMFLLDPQLGNRRRARVRSRATRLTRTTGRALRQAGHALEVGYRQASAGSHGMVEIVRRLATHGDHVSDAFLTSRLRSCIGRHSAHPGAINVAVRDGCATLSGPILADEAREVLECASSVRGLMAVDNRLEVYIEPGSVAELQGAGHRRSPLGWWEVSPAVRVTTGAAVTAATALIALLAGRLALGLRPAAEGDRHPA